MQTTYKDFIISYDPPPIPDRTCDWQFVHRDFDGAPDGLDHRCGRAASMEGCKAEIDDLVSEACE